MSVPTALVDVTITDPRTAWTYLSEGGATMVFSYAEGLREEFAGKVLRLRKSSRQDGDKYHRIHQKDDCQNDSNDRSFAFQDIVSKLIPPQYLPILQVVQVSPQWLKELAEVAEVYRPTERTQKDGIDTSRCKALLATDLVSGEGWAIEIKPKWGFLPSPKHLSTTTQPLKIRYCRFCMHFQLKGIATANGFCPLDLFSGEEERVRLSLRCLWDMWTRTQGKTNNLRVFNRGIIVDPADTNSFTAFLNTLASSLHNSGQMLSDSDSTTIFVEAVLRLILDHNIISILGDLQRTLDSLDIEGLSKLWSISHSGLPLGKAEMDPTLVEWDEFVQTYLSGGANTLRYEVLSYLLSATFKDCSLILRFHSRSKDGSKPDDTITMIDLDPKSVSQLAKWEALDLKIVKNFMTVSMQRKPCIDARRAF